ncbi:carbon-nitrogen hydrolase family protein [Endothiovibrio diazotrophicus]
MTTVAAIQMASGPNVGANLDEAAKLIKQAAAGGARLVVLPENFAYMGERDRDILTIREFDGDGPIQRFLSEQAGKRGVWLVGGTVPIAGDAPERVRAACLLYDDEGKRVARYDKMHLFDVCLPGSGEEYAESHTFEPGSDPVVVKTPFGRLGLAVCYDLRFPELFRRMLDRGMELIALPAAFTAQTGKAHWQPLLRARAIENLCYVVAAAQGGFHHSGRETHGHSLIVDAWGTILQEQASGKGVVSAGIDLRLLESTRQKFPVIDHRRLHCR